jgi:hypothetical protein
VAPTPVSSLRLQTLGRHPVWQTIAQGLEATVGTERPRRGGNERFLHELADLPRRSRFVEGGGERNVSVEEVEVGGVARLDRGYRSPRGQKFCGLYVGDRTVVGHDARVLEILR